jgi:haloalkane dehalogenase
VPELAGAGLRGVAFDLPGLGFAGRPDEFDYSWSGLARWTTAAIDALNIERFHLLLHDIGGPIGFEVAIENPERVMSMTVLNSPIDVGVFHRPWPMHPFSIPVVGEAWLETWRPPSSRWMLRHVTIADNSVFSNAEADAYITLMRGGDGGRAFLKIMRRFELTQSKQDYYYRGLADRPYPAQVVWGDLDTALGAVRREAVMDALGVKSYTSLPGKHFLQEDQAPAIASAVATLARAEA